MYPYIIRATQKSLQLLCFKISIATVCKMLKKKKKLNKVKYSQCIKHASTTRKLTAANTYKKLLGSYKKNVMAHTMAQQI